MYVYIHMYKHVIMYEYVYIYICIMQPPKLIPWTLLKWWDKHPPNLLSSVYIGISLPHNFEECLSEILCWIIITNPTYMKDTYTIIPTNHQPTGVDRSKCSHWYNHDSWIYYYISYNLLLHILHCHIILITNNIIYNNRP